MDDRDETRDDSRMDELDEIAGKITAIASTVDAVVCWLDEGAGTDRAIDYLADVVISCGAIAERLREIAEGGA